MGIFRDINQVTNAGEGVVALGEGSLQPPSEHQPRETPAMTVR